MGFKPGIHLGTDGGRKARAFENVDDLFQSGAGAAVQFTNRGWLLAARYNYIAHDMALPCSPRHPENQTERALILNPTNPLTFEQLNLDQPNLLSQMPPRIDETDNLDEFIAGHIRRVLSKTRGKVNGSDGAAVLMGINPSTLRNRMQKLGIHYGRKTKS